jgi:hypothetical protein
MFSYYLFKDIVYDYLSQFEHRSVLTKFCVDDIMSHFVLNFKSSYHPQTNRQSEKTNQCVETAL